MEEIDLFLLRPPQQEDLPEDLREGLLEEQQVGQPEALQQPIRPDTGHC